MNEKMIHLDVKPDSSNEVIEAAGGVMFEHNATALCFHLDPAYQLPEYKYYLEFVTVHGVMRTDFLEPNLQKEIVFSIPQEVTSQMTALAVLNIVAFSQQGETEQLIKSKTVRLYFSNLENTEKTLCENYAFSVNQLLEAIKNGTFKGEQGETGPMGPGYTLLPTDKQEIADLVNKDHFGLPLYVKMSGSGQLDFEDITYISSLRGILVHASTKEQPVTEMKLTFGENIIAHLITPDGISNFRAALNNHLESSYPIKPNTAYVLSQLNTRYNRFNSYVSYTGKAYEISNQYTPHTMQRELEFSTAQENRAEINVQDVVASPGYYPSVLEKEWDGLTLTEKDKSWIVRQEFKNPLYYIDDIYKDSFDVLSGKIFRKIAKVTLTEAMIPDTAKYTLHSGDKTIYGYQIMFLGDMPVKRPCKSGGYCFGLPYVPTFMRSDMELQNALGNGETVEGLCVPYNGRFFMLYSSKSAEEVKAMVRTAQESNQPIEVVYAMNQQEEVVAPPQTPSTYAGVKQMNVSPHYLEAEITYSADISEKTHELESRIASLENRMNGENM